MVQLSAILLLLAAQAPSDLAIPPLDPGAKTKTPAAKTAPAGKTAAAKTPAAKTAEKTQSETPEEDESVGDTDSGVVTLLDRLDEISRMGGFGLLRRGGFFMWPILVLGIIAFGVIIERYRSLKMLETDTTALRDTVRDLLQQDKAEEALELCNRESGPVPAILAAGIRKYIVLRRLDYDPAKVEEQVVKAMDDYGVHVVSALEKHLPILATISSVAPMLGFLGTVAGMIVSFDEIQARLKEAVNIVELAAGGISVALLTTAFGLVIGIPSFMAYNYFSGVINRFVLEVEESATELIEVVTLHLALEQRAPGN